MTDKTAAGGSMTRVRWLILAMLFAVTTVNYADRATLSIAGSALSKELGLDPITMGCAFSAFGWSYVLAQLPGGWLLDRFGSKRVCFVSIFTWSVFTLLQGGISLLTATVGTAIVALFALRLLVGLAEAPSFPANGRIVAAWFPAKERGTASAIFNSAQYFATVLFAPIMGWVTHAFGWPAVFYMMGAIGIVASQAWLKVVDNPATHPQASAAEVAYIERGGGLVRMDQEEHTRSGTFVDQTPKRSHVRQLVSGTGSFAAALVFVAANALLTVFCYLVVVGDIQRVVLARNAR